MLKEEYSKKLTLNTIALGIILPLILVFFLFPHQLKGFRLFLVKSLFLFAIGYISFDIFSSTKDLNISNFDTCRILMYLFSFILLLLGIQVLFTSNSSSN